MEKPPPRRRPLTPFIVDGYAAVPRGPVAAPVLGATRGDDLSTARGTGETPDPANVTGRQRCGATPLGATP